MVCRLGILTGVVVTAVLTGGALLLTDWPGEARKAQQRAREEEEADQEAAALADPEAAGELPCRRVGTGDGQGAPAQWEGLLSCPSRVAVPDGLSLTVAGRRRWMGHTWLAPPPTHALAVPDLRTGLQVRRGTAAPAAARARRRPGTS